MDDLRRGYSELGLKSSYLHGNAAIINVSTDFGPLGGWQTYNEIEKFFAR